MTERERFINAIKKSLSGLLPLHMAEGVAERVAEVLLKDGAVFPPCKIGDKTWYISTENPFVAFEKELKPRPVGAPIQGILITKDHTYVSTENIEDVIALCDKVNEDYAYLSEEEAQKAIAQRKEDEGK